MLFCSRQWFLFSSLWSKSSSTLCQWKQRCFLPYAPATRSVFPFYQQVIQEDKASFTPSFSCSLHLCDVQVFRDKWQGESWFRTKAGSGLSQKQHSISGTSPTTKGGQPCGDITILTLCKSDNAGNLPEKMEIRKVKWKLPLASPEVAIEVPKQTKIKMKKLGNSTQVF